MVFPKARLLVSFGLFASWIGYLAWLVATTRQPVVLSRSQFLVADLFVVAELKSCNGWPCSKAVVQEVVWPAQAQDLVGLTLPLEGLGDHGPKQGWAGEGIYILALSRLMLDQKKNQVFQITPLPATPGYSPTFATIQIRKAGPNPEKLAQLLTAHLSGLPLEKSMELVKSAPSLVKGNVPLAEAIQLKKAAEALGGDLDVRERETRIYSATPEARAQLKEVIESR